MEKKTEYNEQAFPQIEGLIGHNGMTLLDYMAAKAMTTIMFTNPDGGTDEWSEASYAQAAAMLEERKKYIVVKATDPANGYPSYDSFDHLTGNETETNP